jgi:cytochrome d ubiquinol oxidase subunit I
MVGIGVAMLLITLAGLWLWRGGALERSRGFQRLCTWVSPLGFVAVVAGWVVTEVGRQPWVVYGLLRTRAGVTPSLQAGDVTVSLILYIVTYLVIFGAGLYFLLRLMRGGFDAASDPEPAQPMARTARPLSGAARAE